MLIMELGVSQVPYGDGRPLSYFILNPVSTFSLVTILFLLLTIDAATILSNRTDFAGSYAHSSLNPVSTYTARSQLEQNLQAQFPIEQDQWIVNGTRTAIVWGLGGSGKSQLVLHYVRERQERYQAVFWVEAGQKETLQRDYVQIYKQIYSNTGRDGINVSTEDAVAGVKSWLRRQTRRCLWVMDSADDIEDRESASFIDLDHYLPESPQLDRILTTRSSRVKDMATHSSIAVREMNTEEAVQLFRKSAGIEPTDEKTGRGLHSIVELLGCLPLAVTLAGCYIRETPGLSSDLSRYRAEYEADRVHLLKQRPHPLVHRYGETVLSTWEVSFRAIQRQSPIAANLLLLLAFLNFDDIFPSLFKVKSKHESTVESTVSPPSRVRRRDRFRQLFVEAQSSSSSHQSRSRSLNPDTWRSLLSPASAVLDDSDITSAFKVLQAYSLVTWRADREAYSMHKLVHAWSYDRLTVEQRQLWSLAVLAMLSETLCQISDNRQTESRLVPHIIANSTAILAARHPHHLITEHDQDRMADVGELLHRHGRWDDEYPLCVLLVQLRKEVLGKNHPTTLQSMNRLGHLLRSQGKFKQAEKLHIETLELQEKVLGREHRSTLSSKNNLALTLQDQGKYDQAEEMYTETLRLLEKTVGGEDPDTLGARNNVAEILRAQGKYEQAEKMHAETLTLTTKVQGPEHPDTLDSMNSLGVTMGDVGKYEEAEKMLSQVLQLREKILGPEHPDTLMTKNNMGATLGDRSKYEEAYEMLSETLRLLEKVLGLEHPLAFATMGNLANVMQQQEKYDEEEELRTQRYQLCMKVLGPKHPNTLSSKNDLTQLLQEQGKGLQADRLNASYLE